MSFKMVVGDIIICLTIIVFCIVMAFEFDAVCAIMVIVATLSGFICGCKVPDIRIEEEE